MVALAVDQATKAWVSANMVSHDIRPVIGGFLRLRYTENTGAAFGLFQGWTGALSIVAVAIIAAIVLSASKMAGNNPALLVALGLVLGGALGNLADRVTLGYVRDFIDVYGPRIEWQGATYTWPVFNMADSSITIGVLLIMATMLFAGEHTPAEGKRGEQSEHSYVKHGPSPWFRGLNEE